MLAVTGPWQEGRATPLVPLPWATPGAEHLPEGENFIGGRFCTHATTRARECAPMASTEAGRMYRKQALFSQNAHFGQMRIPV